MSVAYRPRGVPELLDAAFQLMRKHYVPLLVLAAITYIPSLLFFTIVTIPAMAAGESAAFGALMIGFVLAMPILIGWYAIGLAALLSGASSAYQGQRVEPSEALRLTMRRWKSVIGAQLLKWLSILAAGAVFALLVGVLSAVLGGLGVLIALPAVVLPIMVAVWFFAVPAIPVIEERAATDSLGRSRDLSSGHRWTVFWTYVVVYAIIFAIVVAATVPATLIFQQPLLANIVSNLLSILVFPLMGTTTVVLYYDLRIRKEGYDLELMQRELATEPARQPV